MSESAVFELKLQIQHLEEKLTFLAGGTNGAELVEALMEKDEELEKNSQKLKEVETKMFHLAEGAKRVDSRRRELARHTEHQAVRVQALEKELDRQLGISDELRKQVSDNKEDLAATREDLRKTQADMSAAEESARESLATARAEASSLNRIVEGQRETISGLEVAKKGLEETVEKKDEEMKSMEQRKKDVAHRSREMKNHLESLLSDSQKSQADLTGQRTTLEAELGRLRRRMDERARVALEEERKATALARECGTLKTELEAARQDTASTSEELAAVRASKKEADETLLAKDKENSKLRAKSESLKQDLERIGHQAHQDKAVAADKMEEAKRDSEARIALLKEQTKIEEREHSELAVFYENKSSSLEKLLAEAEGTSARLRGEARSAKEEASARARKAAAAAKAEARWRARAEDTLSSKGEELEQLRAELNSLRQQGVELRHMEAENKELKARIERQEVFQKRRMEREKKEKRSRSGTRGSISGASGRAPIQLLPLPPLPGERGRVGLDSPRNDPDQDQDQDHFRDRDREDDGDSANNSGAEERETRPPHPTPSSLSSTEGRPARLPSPTPASRDAQDDGHEDGGGEDGGGGRLLRTTASPFGRPSSVPSRGGGRPKLFSTPDAVRNDEKENSIRTRRAPAWEPPGGGGGGAGDRKLFASDASTSRSDGGGRGDDAGSCRSGGGARGRGLGSINRARERGSSAGKGSRPAARPLESRAIRSVTRSPAVGAPENGRHPSRGRSAVAAKVGAPRSSSVGLQSRAASGWR